MRRLLAPIVLAIPLVLAACSQPADDEPAPSTTSSTATSTTSSSVTSTSSTTTSTAPTSTAEPTPAQEPAPEAAPAEQPPAAPAEVAEPYVVECLFGAPGPSLMSDGTVQNTEYCGNQPGAQEYRDAEAAAGYDPTKIYEDPQLPAYLTRTPEESRQQAEGQGWWSNCMATNTAEYCRATDPYQQ